MRRLSGLDALRGIAALMVFGTHCEKFLRLPKVQLVSASAVDLFFMLSGFVMSRTYEARLKSGDLSPAGFLKKRYDRLWLPMAIGATFGLICAAAQGLSASTLLAYATLLAFLPAIWLPGRFFELNGPSYSLFAEVVTNAVHALALARTRTALVLLLSIACLLCYAGALAAGIGTFATDWAELIPTLCRAVGCYSLGIVIFRLWGDEPLPHAGLAIPAYPMLILLAANVLPEAVEIVAFLAVAPLLIRSAIGLRDSALASWAGALSFPLYAVHQPILRLLRGHPQVAIPTALLAGVIAMLLIEVPRRRIAARAMPPLHSFASS